MEYELYQIGYTRSLLNTVLKTLSSFQKETVFKHILDTYHYFINFGFTSQQIFKMTQKFPDIYKYSCPNLDEKCKNLFSYSYSRKEIIRLCSKFPNLLGLTPNLLNSKRKVLLVLYGEHNFHKMTLECPNIYGKDISELIDKIQYFIHLGYSQEEAIHITATMPSILNLSLITIQKEENREEKVIEKIEIKIKKLLQYGYTYEQIISMGKQFPTLFCLSLDYIQNKLREMEVLNLTSQQIIQMTSSYAGLFCMSKEKLKEKIDFYYSLSLEKIILYDTKRLMQGIVLTQARYSFLQGQNIAISEENYSKLFYSQNQWKKQFQMSNRDTIKLYGK